MTEDRVIELKITSHRVNVEMDFYDVEGQSVVDTSSARFWLDGKEVDMKDKIFSMAKNGVEQGVISLQSMTPPGYPPQQYMAPGHAPHRLPRSDDELEEGETGFDYAINASGYALPLAFVKRILRIGRSAKKQN